MERCMEKEGVHGPADVLRPKAPDTRYQSTSVGRAVSESLDRRDR